MKLRTSFCNQTALKKEITRFAPLWAIYLVGGLLVMLSSLANYSGMDAGRELSQTIGALSVVNLIYAAICAQMLFGDLFQSRMCNALHAMPLRRECWFITHVAAGLAFSVVPHAIGAVCFTLFLGKAWFIAFIWLLAMTLEYLFFFGLAVFCVFCVGNRVAQLAVYGILNFGSMILYWFVDTFYAPLLYGVQIPQEPFIEFCPIVKMVGNSSYLQFERISTIYDYEWGYLGFGEGWGYLTVCAVLGGVLLGLALLLYRKRNLESAGSFIAVKVMEPIFAVVFTLCVGAVFAAFGQLFYGSNYVLYLIVGLIVGWFVGQMLLKRTVKVFHWKAFVKLGILGLAMGISLLVTSWDIFGVTTWMPEKQELAYVEISRGSSISPNSTMYLKLETPEELDEALDFHKAVIAEGERAVTRPVQATTMNIRYTMKDGKTVSRYYTLYSGTAGWNAFRALYSDPEQVLGYTDWESFVQTVDISIEGYELEFVCSEYEKKYETQLNYKTIRLELLEAMKKDVEAGTIVPDWMSVAKDEYLFYVNLEGTNTRRGIAVYKDAKNTAAWYETYEEIISKVVFMK